MKFLYPIDLIEQDDGSFLVCFPDVPEALTDNGGGQRLRIRKCSRFAL